MAGVPYIRFYGDDWLSGTMMLSPDERGVLITIVALTAAQGTAPKLDYDRLPRWLGCTKSKAKKTIENLVDLGKLTIEDGLILNTRSLEELEKSQLFVQKQTENASKSRTKANKNDPKKGNKNNENDLAMAEPNANQPEPEPEPKVIDKSITTQSGAMNDFCNRVFDEWNRMASANGLSTVNIKILNANRKKEILKRLKESGGDKALIFQAIENVPKNPHWLGHNERRWQASFDWIFKSSNFTKAHEFKENKNVGTFNKHSGQQNHAPSNRIQAAHKNRRDAMREVLEERERKRLASQDERP